MPFLAKGEGFVVHENNDSFHRGSVRLKPCGSLQEHTNAKATRDLTRKPTSYTK